MDGWPRENLLSETGGRAMVDTSALLWERELVQKGPTTCSERALNDVRARFRNTRVVSVVFLFRRYCQSYRVRCDTKRSRWSSEV